MAGHRKANGARSTSGKAPAVGRERAALARTLARRSHDAVDQLIHFAPVSLLEEALEAPSAYGGIAQLVSGLAEMGVDLSRVDPEAAAVARAALYKRELLERTPTFTTKQVAELLDVTPQAVTKRRRAGRLLALSTASGDCRYPVLQFGPDGLLPGFVEVLDAFEAENPWVRLELLTVPVEELGGSTLVDLIRTGRPQELAIAVGIAHRHGEHAA